METRKNKKKGMEVKRAPSLHPVGRGHINVEIIPHWYSESSVLK